MIRVLVAPDKLRGTATAVQAAAAIADGVRAAGGAADSCPMSDGGEGFLDVLGGPNRQAEVPDALGRPITVGWRLDGRDAVIETAPLSTEVLRAGPGPVEAEAATSAGAGQLIAAAIEAGARRVLVGLGGSAFTDGGAGAVQALAGLVPFPPELSIVLGCDVRAGYLAAATVFAAQKGADPAAVARLCQRLAARAEQLQARFGRSPLDVAGAGAAGGLAGGLYAAGAELQSGFALVADRVGLDARIARAELVITAEGRLDPTSLDGKVVGGLLERAGRPVWVLAGQATITGAGLQVLDLSDRFGARAAVTDTERCLHAAAAEVVSGWVSRHPA